MKFGRIVLHANTRRLTEIRIFDMTSHCQYDRMTAMITEKCCHLVSAHAGADAAAYAAH